MVKAIRLTNGILRRETGIFGYVVQLNPSPDHHRFHGGHLTIKLLPKFYSTWGPSLRGATPLSIQIITKDYPYYQVEQSFFEAGWDWGMNGMLEPFSRELTHKGRYANEW